MKTLICRYIALPILNTDMGERRHGEVAHTMGYPGRNDVVVRLILLQHEPHRLDIVASEAPVTLGIQIAKRKPVLQAQFDAGDAV